MNKTLWLWGRLDTLTREHIDIPVKKILNVSENNIRKTFMEKAPKYDSENPQPEDYAGLFGVERFRGINTGAEAPLTPEGYVEGAKAIAGRFKGLSETLSDEGKAELEQVRLAEMRRYREQNGLTDEAITARRAEFSGRVGAIVGDDDRPIKANGFAGWFQGEVDKPKSGNVEQVGIYGEAATQFPTAFSVYTEAVGKMNGVEGAEALVAADEEKVKAKVAGVAEFVEKEKQEGREWQVVVYPTGASIEQAKAMTKKGDYFNEDWFKKCEKKGVKPFGEKTEDGFTVAALPVEKNLQDGDVAAQKAEIERRRAAGEKLVAPNLMAGYMYAQAREKDGKDPSMFFRMVESAPVRVAGRGVCVPYLRVNGAGRADADGIWVGYGTDGRAAVVEA